jgi:hypothetical protein
MAARSARKERQARAQSWNGAILRADKGPPVSSDETDDSYEGKWTLRRSDGAWYNFKLGVGGYSTVELVRLLFGYSIVASADYVRHWLDTHPGYGPNDHDGDDEDEDGQDTDVAQPHVARNLHLANRFASLWQPHGNTCVARWIDKRGLDAHTYTVDEIRYLPPNIARAGDAAALFPFYCGDERIGFELNYVDPVHCTRPPTKVQRLSYYLRRGFRGAVTFTPYTPSKIKSAEPVLVCEGWTDTQSVRLIYPRRLVIGTPGVGWWPHLAFAKGDTVILCCDGDAHDSPAAKKVIEAIDHFLLMGCVVLVVEMPPAEDCNSILQKEGVVGLKVLIEAATPRIALSIRGEFAKAAKIQDRVEREAYYWKIKERFPELHLKISIINEEVDKLRAGGNKEAPKPEDGVPTWDGPIDLNKALQACTETLGALALAAEPYKHVAALWVAFVHLCYQNMGNIQTCFHLKLQSQDPGAGKTQFGLAIGLFLPSVIPPQEGFTKATLVRSFYEATQAGQPNPVMILDEADRNLAVEGVVTFINATTTRGVTLEFNLSMGDGQWLKVTLEPFGPMLICGLGDSPPTVASREVMLWMRPYDAEELQAWRIGNGELIETDETTDAQREAEEKRQAEIAQTAEQARAHLMAWAKRFEGRLPRPLLPEYLKRLPGRISESWLQLLAIARLAGGDWPQRVEQAAELVFGTAREVSILVRLLTSIRQALHDQPPVVQNASGGKPPVRPASDQERITFPDLIAHMRGDPLEDWKRSYDRGELTPRWIRLQLLHEVEGGKPAVWWTGPKHNRKHHHGYTRTQLEDAWRRHRIPEPETLVDPEFCSSDSPEKSGAPGAPEENQGVKYQTGNRGRTRGVLIKQAVLDGE